MALDPVLATLNRTVLLPGPGPFVLLGVLGLEALHAWLSVPVCPLYMAAVAGNALLLGLVAADKTLRAPMYQLLGLRPLLTWFWPYPRYPRLWLCSGACLGRSPLRPA